MLGEIAARDADVVAIGHKQKYLRGRTLDEMDALLRAGAERVGVTDIDMLPHRARLAEALLKLAEPGDVVGLMCHAERAGGLRLAGGPGCHRRLARTAAGEGAPGPMSETAPNRPSAARPPKNGTCMTDNSRLAVLIDADNTSPKLIKEMFEELAGYGDHHRQARLRRLDQPASERMEGHLLGNAISPQQQFAYTYGKNATDSALIIDAMDLLYSGNVEGFAIVSSDSDFTPLATRLRESGSG